LTESAVTGVGEELLRARQACGLEITDVAQQLKFAPRQLEALEQERFDLLPGATIARGMLRNYARLLKLDPEPLIQRMADRLDAPDSNRLAERFSQPVPFSDGARRATFVYIGLSLGILALAGGVVYEWRHERTSPQEAAASPPPPEPPAPPLAAQAAVAAPATAPPIAMTQPSALLDPQEHPAAPPAKPVATGPNRLVVRCEEEAWLEVRDSIGRVLVSSLQPAGAERVLRTRPPLTLVIGNASHVQVTFNDQQIDLKPHTRVEVARLTVP
jgi:cytoskeleton protein RodZ